MKFGRVFIKFGALNTEQCRLDYPCSSRTFRLCISSVHLHFSVFQDLEVKKGLAWTNVKMCEQTEARIWQHRTQQTLENVKQEDVLRYQTNGENVKMESWNTPRTRTFDEPSLKLTYPRAAATSDTACANQQMLVSIGQRYYRDSLANLRTPRFLGLWTRQKQNNLLH